MKTLHAYLTRQILATLIMTVAVFTFVLLISNVLKEIIGLLVTGQVSFLSVLLAIALLIPFVLVFALPMGLLTAMLLVFGRFSAENELTAVRASGISLVTLISPLLALSLLLSGVCAWINMEVAPRCRVAYKQLLVNLTADKLGIFLPEKTIVKDFKDRIVWAEEVKGSEFKGLLVYNLDEAGQVKGYIRASEGKVQIDRSNATMTVYLTNCYEIDLAKETNGVQFKLSNKLNFTSTNNLPGSRSDERIKLSDMSLTQLWSELHLMEARMTAPGGWEKLPRQALQERLKELQSVREELTLPIKVQIHRQFSFSFACIGFTLLGIPLGIRAHRRETTFGIAFSLGLVALYYSFFIIGQSLETRADLFPHLILWVPNFIFQALGGVLLWRANRGL
ncbi:MAG TPA: LptF/LptG family permease [Verrucomicrobiae bacterium]